jgi:hypothetical protein
MADADVVACSPNPPIGTKGRIPERFSSVRAIIVDGKLVGDCQPQANGSAVDAFDPLNINGSDLAHHFWPSPRPNARDGIVHFTKHLGSSYIMIGDNSYRSELVNERHGDVSTTISFTSMISRRSSLGLYCFG